MKTFFALLIVFTNGGGGGGELIAFTGSHGREYGLYEDLTSCRLAAYKAKDIHEKMADRWFYVTCVPVSRN